MRKTKNKRIAFLIESLELGGIGRSTLVLAEKIAEIGYTVDLVVAKKKGPYLSLVPSNVNLIDLKIKRMILSSKVIAKYLIDAGPEILISANERVNVAVLMAKMIYKVKSRIIISIHTNNAEQIRQKNATLYKRLILLAARLLYRRADQVVAVSRGVAEDAMRMFKLSKDRVEVIYNPLVDDSIKQRMLEPIEHPWLKEKRGPVILGIGRLVDGKNYEILIEAFAKVQSVMPDAKLIIIGEGKKRKQFEAKVAELKISKKVSYTGFVENPYNYLKHSSLLVLASSWEGLPSVLVEAMAVGTPVVSTDCPSGPAEILENGRYGPLVPVGDVEALADAIISVFNNPPAKEFLINRANDFSVDKAATKYLALFRKLEEEKSL